MKAISDYILPLNPPDVEPLHNLTLELTDAFLSDEVVQNLLLNGGYALEDRPKSFFDLRCSVWNRTHTMSHLLHLRMTRLLAKKSERPEYKEVSPTLEKYARVLYSAFDEFNLQFILGRIDRARTPFLDDDWEEHKLQKRIKRCFTEVAYSALDSAYYNKAKNFFAQAGPVWDELASSNYGRVFVLNQKEATSLLR